MNHENIMNQQIIIVGGSIAGLSTGIFLQNKGIDSIVIEEDKEIGKPLQCSGLISEDTFKELNKIVDLEKINEINTANFYFDNKFAFSIKTKHSKAILIDRVSLDKNLAKKYMESKGKLIINHRINSEELLSLKNSIVVGADGFSSIVAKTFQFPEIPKNKYVKCLQYVVKGKHSKNDEVEIFFSKKYFPGFIAWFIPIDEQFCKIGCGISLNYNFDLRRNLRILMNFYNFNENDIVEVNGGIIPLKIRKISAKKFESNYVFLVGDAAGHVKPLSGGGIFFAHKCGQILANCIANSISKKIRDEVINEYEKLWRKEFLNDLQNYEFVKMIFDSLPYNIILNSIKLLKLDEFISNYGHMDRLSSIFKGEHIATHIRKLL
ncbi:MAG: NAD(P)/FAD-dependent oxidoreductase [Candidatus Aenigmatarchaeota archaeon]